MKILVIEDEKKLASYLQKGLNSEGFVVDVAHNGIDGLHLATEGHYELIILDGMLPDLDGLGVLAALRQTMNIPVLMLTARSMVEDRVKGLQAGADDYLTKPFSIRELLARVKAIFRRRESWSQTVEANEVITAGDIVIERAQRSVSVSGRAVDLTAREFDLLV